MKGKWKAYSGMQIDGVNHYIAGRQLDLSKPLHGGNVEYHGDYSKDRDAVVALCDRLNVGGSE